MNRYERSGLADRVPGTWYPRRDQQRKERRAMRLVQNNVQMVDMSCNICGRPFGRCRHQPGQEYDGVVAGMVMQPIHMTRWDHVRNWFASTNLFELMGMVWFVLAVCNALAWIAERLLWWM